MSIPKRKCFNRSQRLEAARQLLQGYSGKKIVRDYRRYFGVDWQTAFRELEILGVLISTSYKTAVLKTLADLTAAREQEKAEKLDRENPNQNDTIAFIAGYTSGGAPYGITWEDWERLDPDSSE